MTTFVEKKPKKANHNDQVIIIGGGAAGIFCSLQLGLMGIKSRVLEMNSKLGKKIIVSGGGNCNFTNLEVNEKNFQSENTKFTISSLRKYSSQDFIKFLESNGFQYYEKKLGQLFCKNKSKSLLELLLNECRKVGVEFRLNTEVKNVLLTDENTYLLKTETEQFETNTLVIASGGLSFPGIGVSDIGYKVGKTFGHKIVQPEASLVPFVLSEDKKKIWDVELSGVALPVEISCNKKTFEDDLLFTHKGLSGPAILKISLYWNKGDDITINYLPNIQFEKLILEKKKREGKTLVSSFMNAYLPKKLTKRIFEVLLMNSEKKVGDLSNTDIKELVDLLHRNVITPSKTEGFKKAEVTRGGVSVTNISSKTLESSNQKNLYFIGEVLDVTGWLGGYNFQWAWSSAYSASQAIVDKINYDYE